MTMRNRLTEVDLRHDRRLRVLLGDFVETLADERLCELSVNPGGHVFASFQGEHDQRYLGDMDERRIEGFICAVAAAKGVVIDRESDSTLSAELPKHTPWSNGRFQGAMPPASDGHTFTVRMHAKEIYTLQSYVDSGIMSVTHFDAILDALRSGKSILVAGGTFSGKTTLLNAILAELAELRPLVRVVIAEDTNELQCSARNALHLFCHGDIEMLRVVKDMMRQRPDVGVIGEVRDEAAAAYIGFLNSGHSGGMCSVHSDSIIGALSRVEGYISQGKVFVSRADIARAIDLVIVIERKKIDGVDVRRISEVAYVSDGLSKTGEYVLEGVV